MKGHGVRSVAFKPCSRLHRPLTKHQSVECQYGRMYFYLEGSYRLNLSVAFNHDGTKIASGPMTKASKCGMSVRANGFALKGHTNYVYSRIQPRRHQDCIGVLGQSIKVWNVSTGECFYLEGSYRHVESVAFNHDGTKIVSSPMTKASKCGMSVRATHLP